MKEPTDLEPADRCPALTSCVGSDWFEGAFPNGVGNWSQPPELALDGARWPDGLRPLSDAVKESGLEFILWFVSGTPIID